MVGTLKENYCILLSFCITLGLIVVLEVVLAVSLFALADKSKLGNSAIAATMTTSLEHFNQSGYNGVTKGKDFITPLFECVASVKSRAFFSFERLQCFTLTFVRTFCLNQIYHCDWINLITFFVLLFSSLGPHPNWINLLRCIWSFRLA